eukprot:comp12285_c0_seq1/m.7111 comp12285_c0_seq1/g.7111  ORF comp12285_c0_seq1/g.7111 comp12285_c0_seq1/m.7111 type:complete len:575 (-) comp12285_c0_seq1:715-2439(-)
MANTASLAIVDLQQLVEIDGLSLTVAKYISVRVGKEVSRTDIHVGPTGEWNATVVIPVRANHVSDDMVFKLKQAKTTGRSTPADATPSGSVRELGRGSIPVVAIPRTEALQVCVPLVSPAGQTICKLQASIRVTDNENVGKHHLVARASLYGLFRTGSGSLPNSPAATPPPTSTVFFPSNGEIPGGTTGSKGSIAITAATRGPLSSCSDGSSDREPQNFKAGNRSADTLPGSPLGSPKTRRGLIPKASLPMMLFRRSERPRSESNSAASRSKTEDVSAVDQQETNTGAEGGETPSSPLTPNTKRRMSAFSMGLGAVMSAMTPPGSHSASAARRTAQARARSASAGQKPTNGESLGESGAIPSSPSRIEKLEGEILRLKLERERLEMREKEMTGVLNDSITTFECIGLGSNESTNGKPKTNAWTIEFSSEEKKLGNALPIVTSQPAAVVGMGRRGGAGGPGDTMDFPERFELSETLAPGFLTEFFGCMESLPRCLAACFVPCVVTAYTQAAVDGRECQTCDVCWTNAYSTRQGVRAKYDMGFAEGKDCCLCIGCHPCLVSQTAREVTVRTQLGAQ